MNVIEKIIGEAEEKISAIYKQPVKLAIIPMKILKVEEKLRFITLVVCNALSIDYMHMFKADRRMQVAEARMFIMYYAKKHYTIGPTQIGEYLKVHHTTVIHGTKTIEKRLSINDEQTTANKLLIEAEFQDHFNTVNNIKIQNHA